MLAGRKTGGLIEGDIRVQASRDRRDTLQCANLRHAPAVAIIAVDDVRKNTGIVSAGPP